jgi:predicted nuclease of predicted toxin-antitoxin system
VKFLIDECLSPELAAIAREQGFPESTHVTWLSMRSDEDWAIVRRAIAQDFVLVTNNSADFIALYRREEVHAGLVCLNAAPALMNFEMQKSLFLVAIAELGEVEPTNEVLHITIGADGTVQLDRYAVART